MLTDSDEDTLQGVAKWERLWRACQVHLREFRLDLLCVDTKPVHMQFNAVTLGGTVGRH